MYQNSNSPSSSFKPLPRGRHTRDPKELRATRRARLLQAMMELVAKRGYAATTVPEVVARARVSRNAFYEFFEDKETCFLALCDEQSVDLLKVAMSYISPEDWLTSLRCGLRAYLRWWEERPEFSRTYFLEMPTVGARAVAQRRRAYKPFDKMWAMLAAWVRRLNLEIKPVPKRVPRMLTIAITEIIADEIRAGHVGQLLALEEDLMFLIVRLLLGGDPEPDRDGG